MCRRSASPAGETAGGTAAGVGVGVEATGVVGLSLPPPQPAKVRRTSREGGIRFMGTLDDERHSSARDIQAAREGGTDTLRG
jgi:hypothetical protein